MAKSEIVGPGQQVGLVIASGVVVTSHRVV